ncbi:MAG: uroporphyrinogen-III synthase [Cycloclasticus sp.]
MQTNEPITNVLVTRPAHQSTNLCQHLSEQGFQAIRFPTIEIQDASHQALVKRTLQLSGEYDYLIFVSANAVLRADKLIDQPWSLSSTTVVAIGPQTAATLNGIGLTTRIIADKPFDSEQLLKQFPKHLTGQRALIIKGEGGRDLLNEQLRQRGMLVDHADVYKRGLPTSSDDISNIPLHYITITSQLALENLFLLLQPRADELKQQSIFVVFSQRIAERAKALGCQQILISPEASDSGLISAIVEATQR